MKEVNKIDLMRGPLNQSADYEKYKAFGGKEAVKLLKDKMKQLNKP